MIYGIIIAVPPKALSVISSAGYYLVVAPPGGPSTSQYRAIYDQSGRAASRLGTRMKRNFGTEDTEDRRDRTPYCAPLELRHSVTRALTKIRADRETMGKG